LKHTDETFKEWSSMRKTQGDKREGAAELTVSLILIAPFKSFAERFEDTFHEHNARHVSAPYEVYKYDLSTLVASGAEEIKSIDLDCDVVIARGFTAADLAGRNTYIPVVEVAVEATDILDRMVEARRLFPERKIAVVGSSNMVMGVERISALSGIEARAFTCEDRNQIEKIVHYLAHSGFGVVIGGVRTIDYARNMGMEALLLESSREAMWHAITQAKKYAYINRKERERRHSLSTVLNQTNEGIIFLNSEHKIDVFNMAASRILGIQANRALGKRIDQIIPGPQFTGFLSNSKVQKDEIIELGKARLAISKSPVYILGDRIGTVITFQDETHIQHLESRVRVHQHAHGLVARHTFDNILGTSQPIKSAVRMAKQYSQVDSNVIITGQTGTGKEIFAQSIHNHSSRRDGPFVAVNCAALPESLLESELFGYVEGAFTGAAKGGKAGLFELAHRGTIFLDEISEMPPLLQGHLLRVVQEKEIRRLGHDRVIPIDVRIIAAANRDLASLVKSGQFRSDLYYRLHILHLHLPTLDERKTDIPLMVEHWIRWYSRVFGFFDVRVTEEAKQALAGYTWPGNLRQLMGVCEQLVVLHQRGTIAAESVHAVLGGDHVSGINRIAPDPETMVPSETRGYQAQRPQDKEQSEREKILSVLQLCANNRTLAARMLGVSRTTLWRHMQRLEI
jgi:transcriptional regulator with PAS, ATPase and Fis domain